MTQNGGRFDDKMMQTIGKVGRPRRSHFDTIKMNRESMCVCVRFFEKILPKI